MKYIIIIVLIVLYVLWIKKRKKDKSYSAICLAGGLGVLVIAFLSLTTYVTWHNPYTSMEKVLEEKTGTDLLLTDKKSYGDDCSMIGCYGVNINRIIQYDEQTAIDHTNIHYAICQILSENYPDVFGKWHRPYKYEYSDY